MTTKKIFLTQKLDNFILFVCDILGNDHQCVKRLKELAYDYNKFLLFISHLSTIADKDGYIEHNKITHFLKSFDVNLDEFNDEQQQKFKKYLRCFIIVLRS